METRNLIGYQYLPETEKKFKAIDPAFGIDLPGDFYPASISEVDAALNLAEKAFSIYRQFGKDKKAAFLRSIADEILALGDELIERAMSESGLPATRLQGERARTTGQLNTYANLLEEGSWVEAVIDTAIPDRQPLPRADIRKMMVPIGPAVVFGASNFPMAFSVAGGDTCSALAAGCPVITSNVSSLPEVTGGSALLIDPRSVSELGTALRKLIESPELGSQLAAAGVEKARKYTWTAAAEKTLEFFREIA